MLAFIFFLISVNYLSSYALSVSSFRERTPIEENWLNRSNSVLPENSIKILYGRNLSQADNNSISSLHKTNQFSHEIGKRSLRSYGKKRPYPRSHRKRKYATKFSGLTNFIFDGIIDFDQKRSLSSISPPLFNTENSPNKESNKYHNTEPFYHEKQPNGNDKKIREQFSNHLPVVNSEKTELAKTAAPFKPLNKEHPYNVDKSSNEPDIHHLSNSNIPNLDLIYANENFNELKLKPQLQASEVDKPSRKNENDSNETMLEKEFLNSPEYEKALMLRKTNKIEMLINNQNLIKDMVRYALGKGVYPALVALEEKPIDDSHEHTVHNSEAKQNMKPFSNYENPQQKGWKKYQSHENPYFNDKKAYSQGETVSQSKNFNPGTTMNDMKKQFDNNRQAPNSIHNEIDYTFFYKAGMNKNNDKQFGYNRQEPGFFKNEMGYKVQNLEDDKGFGISDTDNRFQVPKGTNIGQEPKTNVFTGSLPYNGGNEETKSNGTNSYNFGHPASESKMNVGRVQKIVLLKTEPISFNEPPNNGVESSNEEKASNYENPDSLNQFQVKPNSRVDTDQKPQGGAENAWTKPDSDSHGNQPIVISQNANSEQKSIHIAKMPPEEHPENTNNGDYKIEDSSEKKITEYAMMKPESPSEQKRPPSLHGPGDDVGGAPSDHKGDLKKTFFAEQGAPPKTLPEGGVALFGNLTEVEFLPLSNKNVSRTILIREETEYVLDRSPTTVAVTLADYSAFNPPVVNPSQQQEDQVVDPTMMRMHVRPFKKKVPLVQDNFRKRRFGSYHSPDQEERNYPIRVEVRRARRQIDESEASCCYNGGTCIADGEHNNSCVCVPAYTGQFCETPVDECLKAKKVCKDHEVCTNHSGEFSCNCAPNFVKEGNDCIPAVTCEEFPCLNGAECQDTEDGGFICNCELGFIGRTCSKRVPECEDSSCSNEEICVSTQIGYKCVQKAEIDNKL